jgi:hypothetical protein
MPYYPPASTGGGASITAQDEGVSLTTAMTTLNFVGAGVTATNTGGAVTATIAGGGSSKPFMPIDVGAMYAGAGLPTYVYTNGYRYANWGNSTDLYAALRLPASYAGGGLTLKFSWVQSGDGDGAHNVQHSAAIQRLQSGTDTISTGSFAAAQSMASVSVTARVSNIVYTETITFTNTQIDGLLAGEFFMLKMTKGGSVTGTIGLIAVSIEET